VRKISPPPGFDARTVQPLSSRYTDSAIRPKAGIFNCINNIGHRHAAKPKTLTLGITQSESRYFAQVEHWGHFSNTINIPKHPNLFALGEKNEQKTLNK
jgi:hypothetical protein